MPRHFIVFKNKFLDFPFTSYIALFGIFVECFFKFSLYSLSKQKKKKITLPNGT